MKNCVLWYKKATIWSGAQGTWHDRKTYLYPREMSLMPHLALSLSASLRMLLYMVLIICMHIS